MNLLIVVLKPILSFAAMVMQVFDDVCDVEDEISMSRSRSEHKNKEDMDKETSGAPLWTLVCTQHLQGRTGRGYF